LHLPGGFRRWPNQCNHTKCCGVDPCCHGNEIWAKIAYNSACMADRPHMFAPTREFSGMADSTEPCRCCGADCCCHGNEILAKIAYNSTCTADRPQMFKPCRGFSGMADSMQPCKILHGRPLLPWQRHLRYARSLIAYRLVTLFFPRTDLEVTLLDQF